MKETHVQKKVHNSSETTLKIALQKILSALYRFPEIEFSLSELAKHAGVSKSTASRLMEHLKDDGIVLIEDKKIILRIKANRDNSEFRRRKIAHNLSLIYEVQLVEYLEKALCHPKAIILFGSHRRGEDISTSDIDIAIETSEDIPTQEIDFPEKPVSLGKQVLISKKQYYERFLGRKIQLHLFNRKRIDINLFNNIANGIVLSGFLEVKP